MTTEADGSRPARRRLLTWGLPVLAVAAGVTAAGCTLGSSSDGGSGGPTTATSRSSTIAWTEDRKALFVTSPDDDQVVVVNPSTLKTAGRYDVAGQPRELSVNDTIAVVTGAQSTDVALIDRVADPDDAVATVPIPCGGSRSVITVPEDETNGFPGGLAVVTCPTDDRLAVVDLGRAQTVGTVAVPGRPTGIVRDGDVITVSTALDGRLHRISAAELGTAADRAPGTSDDVPALRVAVRPSGRAWVDGDRTASTLAALDTGPRGPIGTYQVVDNERELSRAEIEAGSTYGSPKDGRARLEPAIAGACGARFASLADEPRRLSGPVALAAAPESDLVWVVGEFSHSVSVVRCDGKQSSERSATVATFDVGEGARGIVLDDDGQRAYVDVGFDHEVAVLELPDGAASVAADEPIERVEPVEVGRRSVDDHYLSPLAQEGRRTFNDATNTHLTPFGVVTCGSCHPAAGEDGLDWRIERVDPDSKEIERKVRRTPAAWEVDASAKPLHWDGEFTSADDLSLTTIQQLLGGDGLLVDTAPLAAYMAEVLAPPTRPGREGAAAAGQRLLGELGCTSCHAGATGTDGKAHDVLAPSTVADGDLDAVITPRLRSVRGRAPYGHDGRAADLEALLAAHGDGKGGTIELTPEEQAAVVAYLSTR